MRQLRIALPAVVCLIVSCTSGSVMNRAEPPPATYLKPGMATELRAPERADRITVNEAVNEALLQNRMVVTARVNAAVSSTSRREALAAMIPEEAPDGSVSTVSIVTRTGLPKNCSHSDSRDSSRPRIRFAENGSGI